MIHDGKAARIFGRIERVIFVDTLLCSIPFENEDLEIVHEKLIDKFTSSYMFLKPFDIDESRR